ncbi:hypothetical protein ACFX5U_08510 [Sphingobacterium sp. SG20118]|uniref:hypothetical protein n=1 Tax=Sphingobacterium sp. SG20118 TaxID=3367156 RepID=UPI0037DFBFEA
MIPGKLYIATTTLNFNNIMSSESISPAKFYERRGFGYKRFYKVVPNNLDTRIILYEKYPDFNIVDEELENYPMIIEINTKYIAEDIIQKHENIYFSEQTIYLNPFTTNVFFRNEQEKLRTLSNVEQSVESKLVSLYDPCFLLKPVLLDSSKLGFTSLEESKGDFSNYISKDRITNKLKGFLYSYLIASNKSLSSNVVALKKFTKELRNVLSATVTNPGGRASSQQASHLMSLNKKINNLLLKLDNYQQKVEFLIEEKNKEYPINRANISFVEAIKKEGLFDLWLKKQDVKLPYQLGPFFNSNGTNSTLEAYIYPLEEQISKVESNESKLNSGSSMLPLLQNGKIIDIPKQKKFLTRLLNRYLEEGFNSEELMQSRYEFAKAGGVVFREELIDKWENSEWQKYINDLLKNLNTHSAFDINSLENLTLKSFAAFCQKGDFDLNRLEDYLISNEIGDFRIAYGLWGSVFGFANMPKTFTNYLFLSDDLAYVSEVYRHIYEQVHGIKLEGELNIRKREHIESNIELNDNIGICNVTPERLKGELATFEEYNKLNTNIQTEIIGKFFENDIHSLEYWNETIANSIKWNSTKGQKGLIKAISKSIKPKNKKQQSQLSMDINVRCNIFDNHRVTSLREENFIYNDPKAWSYIQRLVPQDLQVSIERKFNWVMDQYRTNGAYAGKDPSNSNVIEHFYNYGKKPGDGKIEPKIPLDILDKLFKELKSRYL